MHNPIHPVLTLDLMLLGVPILSPDLCLAVDPLWLLMASGSPAWPPRACAVRLTMPMPGLGEWSLSMLPGVLHADPAVPGRCWPPPPPEERGLSADLLGGIKGGARCEEEDDDADML